LKFLTIEYGPKPRVFLARTLQKYVCIVDRGPMAFDVAVIVVSSTVLFAKEDDVDTCR
jgi:hypothetical protein